ncbi:hypothetical protein JK386_00810 [Nocardioides sp. zg-536]|uniref:DUF2690 domain-containing protein n=1 Tax=Nocardioides faecalis TaxID=2803858 RepID=A0A939BRB1_9ACTN|nr:hypothetical protein [Nocardioides faecalis]MBM9458439.1 hypothetical protein [Nocardioides faecalis]QVI58453.1 hypothetical protein KG111_15890 [Nocardioides faecalis]
MKKLIATLLTAGALSLGLQATPAITASAEAAAVAKPSTKKCVNKARFRKIKKGMSVAKVRRIAKHRGRIESDATYSDGDRNLTLRFRQCGTSWRYSSIYVSFESTEYRRYVRNDVCYWEDTNWDGSDDTYVCDDYGYWETVYGGPLKVTGKSAYWF